MTSRRVFLNALLTLAALPLASRGQACCPQNAKAAEKKACGTAGSGAAAVGATVVESGEKKTKIKIKCAKCGHTVDTEIDTPTADKPYKQEWRCPRCGHRQAVSVALPQA